MATAIMHKNWIVKDCANKFSEVPWKDNHQKFSSGTDRGGGQKGKWLAQVHRENCS